MRAVSGEETDILALYVALIPGESKNVLIVK